MSDICKQPPVEDVVKFFKENKITPQPGSMSASKQAFEDKACCIIPVLVVMGGEELSDVPEGNYWAISELYGDGAQRCWMGFDWFFYGLDEYRREILNKDKWAIYGYKVARALKEKN